MQRVKTKKFELYRYQILPQITNFQYDMTGEIKNEHELIQNKNRIFADVVQGTKTYKNGGALLVHKLEYKSGDLYVIHFGQPRKRKVTTHEFKKAYVDDYPDAVIVINNDPDVQMIAVQSNSEAFNKTSTLTNIFRNTVNKILIPRNLGIMIEPIFDPKDFWELIKKYDKKITQVKFNVIRPNMPGISKALTIDLKGFSKDTGAIRTSLEIDSGNDSYLNLTDSNETINGLVSYASKGGGNITMRVKGLHRHIKTNDKISETTIDEIDLTGPAETALEIYKQMFNQ